MHPPFPYALKWQSFTLGWRSPCFLWVLLRCPVTSADSRAPLCYFSVQTNQMGHFCSLECIAQTKKRLSFPFYRWEKKKVKQVDQCHKRELKSFLEPQWSLTQTAHFVYMQRSATILLLGLHCNQETKVQKAVFNKYIIYPLEVFSF